MRKVLQWFPTRRRRIIVRVGLALSTLIAVAKVFLMPWLWRYIDDTYVNLPFVLVSVPAAILLCLDLRIVYPPGHCRRCGYNLTGNLSGVCPECGEAIGESVA
jgi:hypothetical protein